MGSVIRAAALDGFRDLASAMGADPDVLLARRGLDGDIRPESLISLEATAHLLEDAAEQLGCPDFGLRLGATQNPSMLGALAAVILNAPDVERLLADVSGYLFVHSPAYEVIVDRSSPVDKSCATLRFGISLDDYAPQRQLIDGCLAMTFHIIRRVGGPQFRVKAISLPHTPLVLARRYSAFFGAPVHSEQPYAGLHFGQEFLNVDLRQVSAQARVDALAELESTHNARVNTMADLVRHTLIHTMGANKGTRRETAALLGQNPRTLQRRLESAGTSFDEIREQVYRTVAMHYLCETQIPLGQVAAALGYSEQSAFTRACRRWFGTTPSTVRATAGTGDSQTDH
ncbi:MAG: AraC family transcriptional regulator [Gordonia amarae]